MLPSTGARDRTASRSRGSTPERVQQLKQRWPCRDKLIEQLASAISCTGSTQAPLFVFGPPATGKTAIVRDVFQQLGVRHAYVNCQEGSKVKPLLSSVLHQLKGAKRRRDEGYDCCVKCDSINEFLQVVPGVVGARASPSAPCSWLLVDHAQRIARSELLTTLMKLRASTGVAVGLLLISAVPWSSGAFISSSGSEVANVAQPLGLHFPAYTPQQLQQILEQRRAAEVGHDVHKRDAFVYKQFLATFVPTFCRASNNLLDLQAAVSLLYPRYRQPLDMGQQMQAPALFARIRRDVQHLTSGLDLQQQQQQSGQECTSGPSSSQAPLGPSGSGQASASQGLSFELPFISKFLLVAAYIASRNKPTSDRQVFDPGYRKRGRKDAQAHDRAVEAAVEARLRGPHGFPLERLLHIFYVLYPQGQGEEEEEEEGGEEGEEERGGGREAWQEMQEAEVLMQLSTLVRLRLLSQTSGDPLECGLYRCNLSEEMAQALAKNVKVKLSDYLKMG